MRSLPHGVYVAQNAIHRAGTCLLAGLQRHLPRLFCRRACPRERHLARPDAPGALARLSVEGIEPTHATVRVEGVDPHESAHTDAPTARPFIVERDLGRECFGLPEDLCLGLDDRGSWTVGVTIWIALVDEERMMGEPLRAAR